MRIINIFAIVDNSLLAVQFDGVASDEFNLLFENWRDVEFLEQFFEDNLKDLQSGFWGDLTVEEAVYRTIDEAAQLEAKIKRVAKRGLHQKEETLQDLVFTSLHKDDFTITRLQSKAYGQKSHSWLRIYAIRISSNLYVVSGGAIKLTKSMFEIPHLETEKLKLKATQEYLKDLGISDEGDYEFIEISRRP